MLLPGYNFQMVILRLSSLKDLAMLDSQCAFMWDEEIDPSAFGKEFNGFEWESTGKYLLALTLCFVLYSSLTLLYEFIQGYPIVRKKLNIFEKNLPLVDYQMDDDVKKEEERIKKSLGNGKSK